MQPSLKVLRLFSTSLFCVILFFSSYCQAQTTLDCKDWKCIPVEQPSGICSSGQGTFYIASNEGTLCEINAKGELIRSIPLGMDIEDLCVVGDALFVMDESLRLIYKLDRTTWAMQATYSMSYSGARNKGFESICYLPDVQHFIVVTEKNPLLIMETDTLFHVLRQFAFKDASDISSATYHDHKLWLLSDEDHRMFHVSTTDFHVMEQYDVPVYNPEGLSFDDDGSVRIVSDDLRRMYIFNPLEQSK